MICKLNHAQTRWETVIGVMLLVLGLTGCNEEPAPSDPNQYKISELNLSAYNHPDAGHPSIADAIVHGGHLLILMARLDGSGKVDDDQPAYLAAFSLETGNEVDFRPDGETDPKKGLPLNLTSPVHLSADSNYVVIAATGNADSADSEGEFTGGLEIVDLENWTSELSRVLVNNCVPAAGCDGTNLPGRFLRTATVSETLAFAVVEASVSDHELFRFGPDNDELTRVASDPLDNVLILDLAVHRVNTPGATVPTILHVLYIDNDDGEGYLLALNASTLAELDRLSLGNIVPSNITYFRP